MLLVAFNILCGRFIQLIQNLGLLVFSICWVSCLDYMLYMFNCKWDDGGFHANWTTRGEKNGWLRSVLNMSTTGAGRAGLLAPTLFDQRHLFVCCQASRAASLSFVGVIV